MKGVTNGPVAVFAFKGLSKPYVYYFVPHFKLYCSFRPSEFANDQQMRETSVFLAMLFLENSLSNHMAKQQATKLCAAVPVPLIESY